MRAAIRPSRRPTRPHFPFPLTQAPLAVATSRCQVNINQEAAATGSLRNTEGLCRAFPRRGAWGRKGRRGIRRKLHVVPLITGWKERGESSNSLASPAEKAAPSSTVEANAIGITGVCLGPNLSWETREAHALGIRSLSDSLSNCFGGQLKKERKEQRERRQQEGEGGRDGTEKKKKDKQGRVAQPGSGAVPRGPGARAGPGGGGKRHLARPPRGDPRAENSPFLGQDSECGGEAAVRKGPIQRLSVVLPRALKRGAR